MEMSPTAYKLYRTRRTTAATSFRRDDVLSACEIRFSQTQYTTVVAKINSDGSSVAWKLKRRTNGLWATKRTISVSTCTQHFFFFLSRIRCCARSELARVAVFQSKLVLKNLDHPVGLRLVFDRFNIRLRGHPAESEIQLLYNSSKKCYGVYRKVD